MAKFNNIDDDFCCPFTCAITTMLGGPGTCIDNLRDGSCVHPAASEVDQLSLSIGALAPSIALRLFSSVFQHEVFYAENEHGETVLAMLNEEGQICPMTPPLQTVEDTLREGGTDAMAAQLAEILELPEFEAPSC